MLRAAASTKGPCGDVAPRDAHDRMQNVCFFVVAIFQYGMYQTAQGGDRSLAIAPFNNLRQHYCLVCAREGGNREAAQVVKLLAAALLYALDLPAEALPPLFSDVKGLCAQFGADSKWRDGVISKLIERLGQEGAKAVAQARKEIEEGLAAMAGKQGSGGVKNAGKGTNEAAMRVVEEKALSLDERVVAATSLVLCVPQKSLGLLHNICLIVLATVQYGLFTSAQELRECMLNSGPFRQLIWIVEDDGPRVPPVVTLLASALNRAFEIACPDQASPPTFSAIQRLCVQFGGDPKWREGVISKFVEHLGREGEKAMEQAHHEIEGALAAVAGKEGSGGLKDAAKGSDETALRVEEDKALCLGSRPAATASPALSAVSGAGCLGTPVPSLDPLEAYQLSLEVDDGPSAKRPRSANAFNPLGSNTITEGELYGVDGGKAGWESSDGESSDGESSDGEEAVRDFADLSVVSR